MESMWCTPPSHLPEMGMFLWGLAGCSIEYVKGREEGFWKVSMHFCPLSHSRYEHLLIIVSYAFIFYLLGFEQYF